MTKTPILKEGNNCWQKTHADQVALLIDGENYFGALHAAIQRAKHSVYILSWDIDSRMQLVRNSDQVEDLPVELGAFISEVLNRNPDLHVYILNWDWAMVYTMEREWLPMYKPAWKSQNRLHFKLDGECPMGASQHQKVVVIDDEIAFSGGFDIGKSRWDSSEHKAKESRRIDPDGHHYPPFHDVQMMVQGEAAAALGDLARERWLKATGEKLNKPSQKSGSAWPEYIEPWFKDIEIGISRTMPQYRDQKEIREVEQLYIDSLKAAENLIYMENQYFTSWKVADLLAERLQERDGPDVVLVLPLMTGGWLEQATMDVLRYRVACKLKEADKHNRLRLCYPHRDELGDSYISVHAKITVIDDCLMRVGSANLSNRSMGFDSECDLVIEAETDEHKATVSRFRERLLTEHFGMTADELRQNLSQEGSLIRLIDARQENSHTLRELDCSVSDYANQMLPDSAIVDPERPIETEKLTKMFIPVDEPKSAQKQWWKIVAVLIVVLALTAIWRWTPLSEWLNPETLQHAAEGIKSHPLTPLIVIGIFAIAGLIAFPVTLLIITTALTFGPLWGTVYSIIGSLVSGLMGYAVGHYMGRNTIQKLAGSSINKLSRRLAKHGVLAIITVRIIPVAPFTVINLVAGGSHINTRDFTIGTLIGMLPGILGITVFADSLMRTVQNPDPEQIAIFVGVVIVIVGIMVGLKRLINRKEDE
ncbi:MAG: VTT domain-containing protein [Pseudomonadota bacterium]|uniref:Phosphatidylserine/phosphatidylglycerophosphate/ cardiolipin synthase and related enzyme n=1 Tax=Methylophaga aminisulfidivorans MP TaxID=1026882 RepID=F5T1G5_9GAMM|nr:VTT domain-containing protein [Methylophaga aminisulfidivorans]EGL53061.1 phosphatidylserine/phosphatidylglycerophosphate/cardiolipin synthase and related enzyme [Methylophaga aminisulfidivorans MP]MEC9413872.1 VTT domain-containing protein [Pseudomonadota bacterium]